MNGNTIGPSASPFLLSLFLGGAAAGAHGIAAALTLALWVVLTGGLHLDRLADCCDGLPHTATHSAASKS